MLGLQIHLADWDLVPWDKEIKKNKRKRKIKLERLRNQEKKKSLRLVGNGRWVCLPKEIADRWCTTLENEEEI